MNIDQEKQKVNSHGGWMSLGNVRNDASEGFFYGDSMTAGGFDSFPTGGRSGAAIGARRHWSSALMAAVWGGCRADLRGVLRSAGINFTSEKVCRSEKNVALVKTALAVRPVCGRRLFAVHAPVVESGRFAALMFNNRPGVRFVVLVLSYGSFSFGGLCV